LREAASVGGLFHFVWIARARGEYIGTVTAPDESVAVRAALKMVRLGTTEAKRLLVRQCRR
jgi:uncharacterized protein with GYD domain